MLTILLGKPILLNHVLLIIIVSLTRSVVVEVDDVRGVNVVKFRSVVFYLFISFPYCSHYPYTDQGQRTGSTARVNACASRASWRSNRPRGQTTNEVDAAKGVVNNTGAKVSEHAEQQQSPSTTVSRVQVASDSLMTEDSDGCGQDWPVPDCEVINRPTGSGVFRGGPCACPPPFNRP